MFHCVLTCFFDFQLESVVTSVAAAALCEATNFSDSHGDEHSKEACLVEYFFKVLHFPYIFCK